MPAFPAVGKSKILYLDSEIYTVYGSNDSSMAFIPVFMIFQVIIHQHNYYSTSRKQGHNP